MNKRLDLNSSSSTQNTARCWKKMRSHIWIVKRPIHDFSILDISFEFNMCWVSPWDIAACLVLTFYTVLFHFTRLLLTHAHKHTHTYSSRSLNCIYTHIQEKEVLMSSFCHYEVVIQWNKLDLHFNTLDGKIE